MSMDESEIIQVYNNEVKNLIIERYGENNKFTKNNCADQSQLVYSSDIDEVTLAVTIPKRNLPKFDTVIYNKPSRTSCTTTSKVLTAAQRVLEIARERGMTLEEVFMHDHLHTSPLFDGDFSFATPDKSKLMSLLETYITYDVEVGDIPHDELKKSDSA
ncbi:MAG: hypothetical protein ABW185_03185 [Sedimenticola sp.]